jgi:D-inositol-3-phosphate glycosyltransferase
MKVTLLTGGKDQHYVRGLARELAAKGVNIALVGGVEEMVTVGSGPGKVILHDVVGNLDPHALWFAKAIRVLKYYVGLAIFAIRTDARLFHILWFRKFPQVERLLLTLHLKLRRKTLVFTAHNVDDRARDGRRGGILYALSLRFLYRLADHVLVHTKSMKLELSRDFGIPGERVTVVPLGINDVIPVASTTQAIAREKLGLAANARVFLFFGNIAPCKGVEDLIRALATLVNDDDRSVLLTVGRVRDRSCEPYWRGLEQQIAESGIRGYVRHDVRYVHDEEVELFFRAADVSILPYRKVYQSGVLGLSYALGVPVIAADIASMKEDIVDGHTGFLFRASDWRDLAAKVRMYYVSDLLRELEAKRVRHHKALLRTIRVGTNAERTRAVYEELLR